MGTLRTLCAVRREAETAGKANFAEIFETANAMRFLELFFKRDCFAHACAEGKRKKNKRENYSRSLQGFCRKFYFFVPPPAALTRIPDAF